MKILIEKTGMYSVYYHKYKIPFRGCQCYKSCSCAEDHKNPEVEHFTVLKTIGKKHKSKYCNNLKDVFCQIQELENKTSEGNDE